MKLLTYTTLFPNAAMPTHGVFVRERMFAFRRHTGSDLGVVAPVPWWPPLPGPERWRRFARVPRQEVQGGVPVGHPRYVTFPWVGMAMQARLLELCTRAAVERRVRQGGHELIDAHYLYPDGVAAVGIGRRLGLPVVLTARGTDVSFLSRFPRVGERILAALTAADAVVTVCDALRRELVDHGVNPARIRTVGNAVDPGKFPRIDRDEARESLGLDPGAEIVLSVGALRPVKGHDLLIRAVSTLLPRRPRLLLLIAGSGEQEARLRDLVAEHRIEDRVRLVGTVAHQHLYRYYSAADLLALASSREGWPNVLLEAMCCGLPVVATAVGGVPEVVRGDDFGILPERRSVGAISEALREALERDWSRSEIAAYARGQTWDRRSRELRELFDSLL